MNSSTFDRSVLDHLGAALGDKTGAFTGRLIAAYQNQVGALLESLTSADEKTDLAGLVFAAHTLKGSSSAVGGLRLAELCADLEQWSGDPIEARSLVRAVHREAAALSEELAGWTPRGTS